MQKDFWTEGKYIDLWTINHVLSGVLSGSILHFLGTSLAWSFAISSILFIGWEVIERIFEVEAVTNQIMDLIADYVGYGIFYGYAYLLFQPLSARMTWFLAIAFVSLELWGFYTWSQRKKLVKLYNSTLQ
jgi:hypothetical protein